MSESLQEKALRVVDRLEQKHPDARIWLDWETPYGLLVALILAAQCTDEKVNQVVPRLFEQYPGPRDIAEADPQELHQILRPTGFYRRKTKSVQNMSAELLERHHGEVPADVDALTDLPGVGRKTANILLGNAFGQQAIGVDTHVKRVSRRLGLAESKRPDKIERQLCDILPEERWTRATQLLTTHGRRLCLARNPHCEECPLDDLCSYYQQQVAGADR